MADLKASARSPMCGIPHPNQYSDALIFALDEFTVLMVLHFCSLLHIVIVYNIDLPEPSSAFNLQGVQSLDLQVAAYHF